MQDHIVITGARTHNLKDITVALPKNKLVVATGLSGSGKSTLIFDILHSEGQRQYVESMGISRETLQKPEVDSITGLSPSIAVEQRAVNLSPRSTVGTTTEIFTYLRLLYARIGHRPCTNCGQDVPPMFATFDSEALWDEAAEETSSASAAESDETYACPHCAAPLAQLSMAHFSFNTPLGACPTCTGLGTVHQVNIDTVVEQDKSILDGAVKSLWTSLMTTHHAKVLQNAGQHFGFQFDPSVPVRALGTVQRDLLFYGVSSPEFQRHVPDTKPPKSVSAGNFEGVLPTFLRRYQEHANDADYREEMERSMLLDTCPACRGKRLRPESLNVTIDGRPILDVAAWTLLELARWFAELPNTLPASESAVATAIVADLERRTLRLLDVGVGYLSLDRGSPTLSAGEAQRLRLAALLGSGLTGVLYVLDEPTTGLHPRDNGLLIESLRRLRDLGNTVVVIEHDLEIVAAADHVLELGPGAGDAGGTLTAAGTPEQIAASNTVTGRYLAGVDAIPIPARRNLQDAAQIVVHNAHHHNLQNVKLRLPLGGLVAVSGVSGSGKSTLMLDILDRAARQHFFKAGDAPGAYDTIEGFEHIDKIITADQAPIGRTPRSNAATYTEAFDPIRKAFAATSDAKQRKLKAEHFSFNVAGGRCERCQGAGVLTIKMHFMPEALVRCPACHGRRFTRDVLSVQYQGRTIADVLEMTISEANAFFGDVAAIASKLSVLEEVGLGYLKLGQPATTLSGGEIQRIKLAKELSRRSGGRSLYLLDEPTTGLHVADVARLLQLLQRLVDAGNTVIAIEHNLDLIKSADWVIDLGPEGGSAGGRIIAEGTPEQIAEIDGSYTGRALRAALQPV